MTIIQRFFGHLRTVSRHRREVRRNCFKAGIPLQGMTHDLSKFSPTEFRQGVRFYDGTHSPTEDERRTHGYSIAWMHHKGRNRHHWEYWTDYSVKEGRYMPVPMPRQYLAETICDRIAASKTYKGAAYDDSCPLDYLQNGKMRDNMHPQTLEEITRFLTILRDQGENAMFTALRKWLREEA